MSSAPPRGVYVPVPTFFETAPTKENPTPAVSLSTQSEHAVHLARSGIRGLVLLGSSGEAIALSNEERTSIIKHVKSSLSDAGFADYPLIAGTAIQGIDDTVSQLQEAAAAGSQWGMVLAPGYFAPSAAQEGLALWFEVIAERSPIPILVYHYPGVSNNVHIAPSTFARLAQHKNIVGCKLSHANLSHHSQVAAHPDIVGKQFATFSGLGQQLLPVLSVGGAGAIDGLAGIFPKTVVRLFDLFTNGKQVSEAGGELQTLQWEISQGEELIVKYGVPGIKAGVARALGMGDPRNTRLPMLGGMPEGGWKEFDSTFERLIKIEASFA